MNIYDYKTQFNDITPEELEFYKQQMLQEQTPTMPQQDASQQPIANSMVNSASAEQTAPQQSQPAFLGQSMENNNQAFQQQASQADAMASQSAAQLQSKRDGEMKQAEQQASQALQEQQKKKAEGIGKLLTIGTIIATGGFGGGIGSAAGASNYLRTLSLLK